MTDEKKAKLSALAKNLEHGKYDMLVAVILDLSLKKERAELYDNAKGQWRDWSNSKEHVSFWHEMNDLTRDYHDQNMLVLLWCRQELGC